MSYYLSFLFLLLSLSMDTFLAAVSFGISNIKVPIYSIITLSFINTLFLIIACFLGEYIKLWIPISMIRILSSFPFFILGYLKIKTSKNLFQDNNLISIYQRPQTADRDYNKKLSFSEMFFLAISLSIDNLTVGIGITIEENAYFYLFLLNFLLTLGAFLLGTILFSKFSYNSNKLSFISGIILIFVGIYRMF